MDPVSKELFFTPLPNYDKIVVVPEDLHTSKDSNCPTLYLSVNNRHGPEGLTTRRLAGHRRADVRGERETRNDTVSV